MSIESVHVLFFVCVFFFKFLSSYWLINPILIYLSKRVM